VLIGVASGPEVDRSGLASRRPRRRVKREASGWGTGLVTGVDGRRRRRAGVQRQHSRLAARRPVALDADARSTRDGEWREGVGW
jgi:hypothetical protein